jgi:hypothetical protein
LKHFEADALAPLRLQLLHAQEHQLLIVLPNQYR